MRVKILGMCGHLLDETSQWDQVWGLAHDPEIRFTHAFEGHSEAIIRKWNPKHIERLKFLAEVMPLYTAWPWAEDLGPNHHLLNIRCTDRFESSVAYPLAKAIDDGAEKIGLYGIDMEAGSEYAYQRPNIMYLIGRAEERGIEVEIHPRSSLLKSNWTAPRYGHPDNLDDLRYFIDP